MKGSFFLFLFIISTGVFSLASEYEVGLGMHDITGPAAEMMMMGYVNPKQKTAGIHLRLRSRSAIIRDVTTEKRVVLVSIDEISGYESVTQKVVEKLRQQFGNLYTEENLLIQATHTHSAPGGFSYYKLYYLSTLGFSQQNFDIIVEGIYQSILKAHRNLVPGSIKIAEGEVQGLGTNRSLASYLRNPEEERDRYNSSIDKSMTVIKFQDENGKELGVFSWYAMHATSMKPTNQLISSDSKGFASLLFEKNKGVNYFADRNFVAAFPNTNAGDVSPTIGKDLDGDDVWDCPLIDSFKCTEWSGRIQYEAAYTLYSNAEEELKGAIDYRHEYIDFSKISVGAEFTEGQDQTTCTAGIGVSMLAGTEDGRGIGTEGQRCSSPSFLSSPLCLVNRCHGEKPVALDTGSMKPDPWTPNVLPISVIKIGQLVLIGVPAEFTTMSGRRAKDLASSVLKASGAKHFVLAGYANAYAGYVATPEEYDLQNYEGASTHFGKWTLPAYLQEIKKLSVALLNGTQVSSEGKPKDLTNEVRPEAVTSPAYDTVPSGKKLGFPEGSLKAVYKTGEVVSAQFWGGYPNRNPLIQSSYLEIQKLEGSTWVPILYDWDKETKFHWQRQGLNHNLITILWETSVETKPGTYRILNRGTAKSKKGSLRSYQGFSNSFEVQ